MVLNRQQVDALLNRDNETFEYIYEQTHKSIYRMIYMIVYNHMTTEELMQEVYMKMLVKIEQYKIGANFKNWLLQIAKYHAIDYYRKNKKQIIMNQDFINHYNEHADSPAKNDYIDQILSILTPDERLIFSLRVIEDLKHKDIAKLLNKPIGTVLWSYQKANKKIKDFLGEKHV